MNRFLNAFFTPRASIDMDYSLLVIRSPLTFESYSKIRKCGAVWPMPMWVEAMGHKTMAIV